MNYQVITLENGRINLYKEDGLQFFGWDIETLIKNINKNKKLYIIYLEKVIYYKNLFLNSLEKSDIRYEIITKSLLEIKKYIYNYWIKNDEEIIDINKVHLFIILDLKDRDLNISFFKLSNTINKLDIKMVYEDYIYIGDEKDEQYLFLDIVDEIQKIMRRSHLRDKSIAKVLLVGKETNYRWFINLFKDSYSEESIDVFNYDIAKALEVYLNIEKKDILDPFDKSRIKYFSREIVLKEVVKGIDIERTIQVVNKYERLPINKNIIVSPMGYIGGKNDFSVESDDIIYSRKISFPFAYNFDELKFNFKIEIDKTSEIGIYINNNIVDTWNINWGERDEI